MHTLTTHSHHCNSSNYTDEATETIMIGQQLHCIVLDTQLWSLSGFVPLSEVLVSLDKTILFSRRVLQSMSIFCVYLVQCVRRWCLYFVSKNGHSPVCQKALPTGFIVTMAADYNFRLHHCVSKLHNVATNKNGTGDWRQTFLSLPFVVFRVT